MIQKLFVLYGKETNPYHNLAVEESLLRWISPGACVLYLWQNEKTVVIGKNQNAIAECNVPMLEHDGGHLARRISGGGAVFHDLGNLNFTFVTASEDFQVTTQTEVILRALHQLGIPAERNGRNDLTLQDRKFSGHAYYRGRKSSFHHGTLMLQVDLEKLSAYLRPSPLKLSARMVSSVRSRVVNLCDLLPDLTTDLLKEALADAFGNTYGLPCRILSESSLAPEMISEAEARLSSPEWILADARPLPCFSELRTPNGLLRLDYDWLDDSHNRLSAAILSTDALETSLNLAAASAILQDSPLDPDVLRSRLLSGGVSVADTEQLVPFVLQLPGRIPS
ncbi:MAG: lipoate--protein ligase [Oscillospiraceae bacterium]|nr:lipoate--protein ligase [Oscillospiraceae bacterium]